MAQIIDGKRIAKEIKDKLKEEVSVLKERGTKICLAVIQVGQDAASSVYVNNKKKACAYVWNCVGKRHSCYRIQASLGNLS